MLDVQTLSFDYHDKPLLRNVHFSLLGGELLYLRGANGAGKTTLLKLLAGLLQPHEGSIFYENKDIKQHPDEYQRQLCYVGHKAGLNPLLTVKENCCFDMHWGRQILVLEKALADFGLQGLENTPCYLLSAGQRRRVSLLRIVMTDARLWLLDEPFVALDMKAMQMLTACLQKHLACGGQVILTSHQTVPFRQPYREYSL